MSTVDIAAALQTVGGALSAGVDSDRLLISGNGLASGLGRIFEIMADVLHNASYPQGEVATERARLIDRLQVAQSQPAHLARVALLRGCMGSTRTRCRPRRWPTWPCWARLSWRTCTPTGSGRPGPPWWWSATSTPRPALDQAEQALGTWSGGAGDASMPPIPPLASGPIVLADRPGSVQSSIRLALPAVGRTHPDHAALQLANLIFGGYFSSRWVENIREDKGYTYGPHSIVDHSIAGSSVIRRPRWPPRSPRPRCWRPGTSWAGWPPLRPARTSWSRLGSTHSARSCWACPRRPDWLDWPARTLAFGLRLDFLAEHAVRLAAASREEVAAAAGAYLAPAKAATVVLGDASLVENSLATLAAVTGTAAPVDTSAGVENPQPESEGD